MEVSNLHQFVYKFIEEVRKSSSVRIRRNVILHGIYMAKLQRKKTWAICRRIGQHLASSLLDRNTGITVWRSEQGTEPTRSTEESLNSEHFANFIPLVISEYFV